MHPGLSVLRSLPPSPCHPHSPRHREPKAQLGAQTARACHRQDKRLVQGDVGEFHGLGAVLPCQPTAGCNEGLQQAPSGTCQGPDHQGTSLRLWRHTTLRVPADTAAQACHGGKPPFWMKASVSQNCKTRAPHGSNLRTYEDTREKHNTQQGEAAQPLKAVKSQLREALEVRAPGGYLQPGL